MEFELQYNFSKPSINNRCSRFTFKVRYHLCCAGICYIISASNEKYFPAGRLIVFNDDSAMLRLGNIRDEGGMVNSSRCTWTPLLPPPSLSPSSNNVFVRNCGASCILVIFHMHFVKRAKPREDGTRGSRGREGEARPSSL